MLLGPKFEAFVDKSPLSVMMRGIVERIFHPDRLELIFEEHAVTQYTRHLPFHTVAEVLSEVVFTIVPSVGAGLQAREGTLPVSRRAFYCPGNERSHSSAENGHPKQTGITKKVEAHRM